MKIGHLCLPLLFLSACHQQPDARDTESKSPSSSRPQTTKVESDQFTTVADPLAQSPRLSEDEMTRLGVQVMLDRAGFSPGVIDGAEGENFTSALRGLQEAHDLPVTGKADEATRSALEATGGGPATRYVRIPRAFDQQRLVLDLPKDPANQAKLPGLGYKSLVEALAERFHTTPAFLMKLNSPETKVGTNRIIRVPNIADPDGAAPADDQRGWGDTLKSLGISANQLKAARIVVDKSDRALKVFDAADKLIAQFPATMGSGHDPLPLGTWKVQGISRNPEFHYNPKLFWDVSDRKDAQLLPPGPNGPVGVVWLDLSKPHYGIHGTSEPDSIGRAQSHGCVRLTNWDAARLAQMIGKLGLPAIFKP